MASTLVYNHLNLCFLKKNISRKYKTSIYIKVMVNRGHKPKLRLWRSHQLITHMISGQAHLVAYASSGSSWLQDMINIDKLFKHLLENYLVKVVILLLLFNYFCLFWTL